MSIIVKIKQNKLNENVENPTTTVLVTMKSKDFLRLTTNDNIMSDLEKRYQVFSKDKKFDISIAEDTKPYLNINDKGKVTNHAGRLRSYANIKTNGDDATMKYQLNLFGVNSLNELSNLIGQYDTSQTVSINDIKITKDTGISKEDVLDVGEGKTIPAGSLSAYTRERLSKFWKSITPEITGQHQRIVSMFNEHLKNYTFVDDKRNEYQFEVKIMGMVKPVLTPKPPDNTPITIKRKE